MLGAGLSGDRALSRRVHELRIFRKNATGVARWKWTIIPSLGNIAPADLGRLQAQQWASRLSASQSPGSVRKIVKVLSAGLQLAVDDGRIPANPAMRLKLPRQSKAHKKFLTHEQVASLAEAVEAKPEGEGCGLLILVLAYTGLRWGELSGLRVRHLEVRSTMIEIPRGVDPRRTMKPGRFRFPRSSSSS